MLTLQQDFRGQYSWARVSALACLFEAVWGQHRGMPLENIKLWLAMAATNYGASKVTEMVAILKEGGVSIPDSILGKLSEIALSMKPKPTAAP